MRVYVQWSKGTAQDWVRFPASDWGTLAKKAEPTGGETLTQSPGWVNGLLCQGVDFTGWDHYRIVGVVGRAIKITVWNDDPVDWPAGTRHAEEWVFRPYHSDPDFGGATNTRQSHVVYRQPSAPEYIDAQNRTVEPWSNFVRPGAAGTRHGIWMTDRQFADHGTARTSRGWRHWGGDG